MKAIKLNGETYSKLAPFVDAFGKAMASGKGAETVKDDIRHIFDIGNHKGETFTTLLKGNFKCLRYQTMARVFI